MYKSLIYPYWVTFLLSFLAAGFLVRLFIIFHDCGHGSFFRSQKANGIVGKLIGILAFTPYSPWHYNHKIHHATAGNLDKRDVGDVWTLTVNEYINSSKRRRLKYRLYRNPFVLFIFGAVFVMLINNRLTKKWMKGEERSNVYITNIGIILMAGVISSLIGIKAYLLVQLPILVVSQSIGLWLFYVQHQYEDVFWEKNENWDYKRAAIEGSSFLKLPPILQWFTGNIGFHHVHHLSSRIPNYNLARCHYENDLFRHLKPITLFSSFRTLKLRLWDEASRQMVSFSKIAVARK
jgi:omega-6 fatty acid desaturase (delta-12 desaturase)